MEMGISEIIYWECYFYSYPKIEDVKPFPYVFSYLNHSGLKELDSIKPIIIKSRF